jgi:hypothetical protein
MFIYSFCILLHISNPSEIKKKKGIFFFHRLRSFFFSKYIRVVYTPDKFSHPILSLFFSSFVDIAASYLIGLQTEKKKGPTFFFFFPGLLQQQQPPKKNFFFYDVARAGSVERVSAILRSTELASLYPILPILSHCVLSAVRLPGMWVAVHPSSSHISHHHE